jgi:hypothetical protein
MRAAGWSCGVLAMLAVLISPTPAPAASGLEPGVHIDPGSPAEKQYVLPLNQARQTGAAGTGRSGASGVPFGAGIKPPGGGSGTPAGPAPAESASPASATAKSRPASSQAGRAASTGALPPAVLRASREQGSSAGSGSWLALLGGGLAILLLGGFGGTVLRHSRRPTPTS